METARDYAGALIRRVRRQPGSGPRLSPPPGAPHPSPLSAAPPGAPRPPFASRLLASQAPRNPERPAPPRHTYPCACALCVPPAPAVPPRPERSASPCAWHLREPLVSPAPEVPRHPLHPATRSPRGRVPAHAPSLTSGAHAFWQRGRQSPSKPRGSFPSSSWPLGQVRRSRDARAATEQVTVVSAGVAEFLAAAAAAVQILEDPVLRNPGNASTGRGDRASRVPRDRDGSWGAGGDTRRLWDGPGLPLRTREGSELQREGGLSREHPLGPECALTACLMKPPKLVKEYLGGKRSPCSPHPRAPSMPREERGARRRLRSLRPSPPLPGLCHPRGGGVKAPQHFPPPQPSFGSSSY